MALLRHCDSGSACQLPRDSPVGPTVSAGQCLVAGQCKVAVGLKCQVTVKVRVIDFGSEWLNNLFSEKKTRIQMFRAGGGGFGAGVPVPRERVAR